ncbi:MAG: DUF4124 domain-containing protein [Gammaproteobacteria bacterium]|nr:DUF4124 domain-containing protein [Gammaproteobacteria bacterium]
MNMRALGFLIFPALLGISLMAQGQVYQSTDEEGNVSFSDQPTPDSKEIVVPETNVGDSVDVPPPAPEPAPEIVADDIPATPQGDLYVKEKDNSSRRRRRPRPGHHGGGGHGR